MLKRFKSTAAVLVLVFCVLAVSGCVAVMVGAAAGAGGYAWMKGVLEKDFQVTAEDLQKATVRALKDLKVIVYEEDRDRLTAKFRSEFADGQNIAVDIKALTEQSSRIKIRVGMFGNRSKSEMILNAIEKHL